MFAMLQHLLAGIPESVTRFLQIQVFNCLPRNKFLPLFVRPDHKALPFFYTEVYFFGVECVWLYCSPINEITPKAVAQVIKELRFNEAAKAVLVF